MNKLVRATGLCVVAALLLPVASANAQRTTANCTVHGIAVFGPENLKALPEPLAYEFHGSAVCETLPAKGTLEGTVAVEGTEKLSCFGSLGGGENKGKLTVGGVEFPFHVTFVSGAPGSTAMAVSFEDGGVGTGSATFLGSQSERATQCFLFKGAHTLEFEAVASGEF